MNLKIVFQPVFEEEDSKVPCSSVHDHMYADMEKPRTVECLIFFYIYIFNLKIYMTKLLNTLLKLLCNTTTTIPRGAKYNDNPEALKKRKVKRKTFKRRPDRTIKKDIEQKINKTKRRCKERVLGGCVVCSRVWKELNFNDRCP